MPGCTLEHQGLRPRLGSWPAVQGPEMSSGGEVAGTVNRPAGAEEAGVGVPGRLRAPGVRVPALGPQEVLAAASEAVVLVEKPGLA